MPKYHFLLRHEVAKNVRHDLRHLDEKGIDNLRLFARLYYSLEFALGQVHSDSNDSYYPNASFSILKFIADLKTIQTHCYSGARFLDVGCGLGSKVWIAQELGFDAYGIEINPKYARIASEHVQSDHILCDDGVTYCDYGKYDVIYFYNPMPTSELEIAILNGAREGAVIYHAIELQTQPSRTHVRISNRLMLLTSRVPERDVAQTETARSLVGEIANYCLGRSRHRENCAQGANKPF